MSTDQTTQVFLDALHKDLSTLRDEQRGTTTAVRDLQTTMAGVAAKLDGVADLGSRVRDLELANAANGSTHDIEARVDRLEKWQVKVTAGAAALGAASGGVAGAFAKLFG